MKEGEEERKIKGKDILFDKTILLASIMKSLMIPIYKEFLQINKKNINTCRKN